MEETDEEINYGIDITNAHPRAIELVSEEFFWDCTDELAPFGSDEGDTALAEFRDWRKENPESSVFECIKWTIEDVGEMSVDDYNEKLFDESLLRKQVKDEKFDKEQYIFTLDIAVIATGFGQLVDEGKIDSEVKPYLKTAIARQKLWAKVSEEINEWYEETADDYIERMNILFRVLETA